MSLIAGTLAIIAASGVTTESIRVTPLTEAQIAQETMDICVENIFDATAFKQAVTQSKFEYIVDEENSTQAAGRWDSSFGWLQYISSIGGRVRYSMPQCHITAYTREDTDIDLLWSEVSTLIEADYGQDYSIQRIGDEIAWRVYGPGEQAFKLVWVSELGGGNRASFQVKPVLGPHGGVIPNCDEEATFEMKALLCAEQAFSMADKQMMDEWKTAYAAVKIWDAGWDETLGDPPNYYDTLLTAQRDWETYRDSHCRTEGILASRGADPFALTSACETAETLIRAEKLRTLTLLAEMGFRRDLAELAQNREDPSQEELRAFLIDLWR